MIKVLPLLGKQKLSKNHKRKMIKLNVNYTLIIGIVMIGYSNYIGTRLSGLILDLNSKEKTVLIIKIDTIFIRII